MLLQRLGRLWRHIETIRPVNARREAWILSPELSAAIASPEFAFGATAWVYAHYVLCRSLSVWQGVTQVNLPGQIRKLIEATYAKQDESEQMAKHLHQVETMRSKLERLALLGLSKGGSTLPEEKAQMRHSELESTEVLLIRAYQPDAQKRGTWVTLLNYERLWVPQNGRSMSPNAWRTLSATLMQNTLKVTDYLAPEAVSKTEINWLADYFYLGKPEFDESNMLRVALVDESDTVKSLNKSLSNGDYFINYDAIVGYQTSKRKKS